MDSCIIYNARQSSNQFSPTAQFPPFTPLSSVGPKYTGCRAIVAGICGSCWIALTASSRVTLGRVEHGACLTVKDENFPAGMCLGNVVRKVPNCRHWTAAQ